MCVQEEFKCFTCLLATIKQVGLVQLQAGLNEGLNFERATLPYYLSSPFSRGSFL